MLLRKDYIELLKLLEHILHRAGFCQIKGEETQKEIKDELTSG